jgi:hypothetical protein
MNLVRIRWRKRTTKKKLNGKIIKRTKVVLDGIEETPRIPNRRMPCHRHRSFINMTAILRERFDLR